MTLAQTTLGPGAPDLLFCHGLFGQGKNWTQIAKALAAPHVDEGLPLPASDQRTPHTSVLMDMPNHGRSDWTDSVDYPAWADLIATAMDGHRLDVVGHSMGGKIAMQLAVRHPELVRKLMIVDIAPADYRGLSSFNRYVEAMRAVDLRNLANRAEADAAMRDGVPDPVIRGFLLQNLRRAPEPDNWRWQMNLDLLGDHLDQLGGWPATTGIFDGPVVWVSGADSDYVRPAHRAAMHTLFPRLRSVRIKGAGHWVHSEQPEAFTQTLRALLDAP